MHAWNREHAFTKFFNFSPSLTNEPICLFFQWNPLCSYILIGNCVRVKNSGFAPWLENARPPGSPKVANAPPRGLTRRANALQWPGVGGGGGGAGRSWNWLMHNRRLFLAAENGLVDLLELVVLFLLRSRGELSVLKTGKRFPWMLYLTLLRFFFPKEKGKYTVPLINRCSFILPAFSIKLFFLHCSELYSFLITQFLSTEALGKNTLADRR